MAKRKAADFDPLEPVLHEDPPKHAITLKSPHGGPAQVGTADDPKEIDAAGLVSLDREKDSALIDLLMSRHGFTEVQP